MARHGKAHQADLHKEADKFEPRLAAAFKKAVSRLDNALSINELARVIHKCQVEMSQGRQWAHFVDASFDQMISHQRLEAIFWPMGAIVKDAFMRGGKLGADHVNEVRSATS